MKLIKILYDVMIIKQKGESSNVVDKLTEIAISTSIHRREKRFPNNQKERRDL